MPVAEYMRACLTDPEHGYYSRAAAIGREGDFTTSPEISQIFGELAGLWCVVFWHAMGSPHAVRLIELGPGRGTLIGDALRAGAIAPGFLDAVRLHLVESNHTLRASQARALAATPIGASWHESWQRLAQELETAEPMPSIVIANEFLDAMPVEQFVFRDGCWLTRCVGLDTDGALAFTASQTAAAPPPYRTEPRDGDILGVSLEQHGVVAGLLAPLASRAPLAALVIDFGHGTSGLGDTLAGIRGHASVSPLDCPGETDLSASVDFDALARSARAVSLAVDGPLSQAEFLANLGIGERASRLMASNPARAAEIEAGVARLMAPMGMGTRFKAIGIRSPQLPPLPGLTPLAMRPRDRGGKERPS